MFVVPVTKGVISTGGMVGAPAFEPDVPWASMVAPCGIDAIRASDAAGTAGLVVGGTLSQIPGSKWMPTLWFGVVTSLIVWR